MVKKPYIVDIQVNLIRGEIRMCTVMLEEGCLMTREVWASVSMWFS